MFCITMTGKTGYLFAKAFTLTDAKREVAEEFEANPGYFKASIYDQASGEKIERFRGKHWQAVKVTE